MRKALKPILTFILLVIGCQIISIHYNSMYRFLSPMFKMGCFNITYNFILNYIYKSEYKDRLIREKFNKRFYYIFTILAISYLIENTIVFYSYKTLTESLISSSKAEVPSVQVYGWRCSGVYYAETKCDLESQNSKWSNKGMYFIELINFYSGLIKGETFYYGSSGSSFYGDIDSGHFISCSVGHAQDVKYHVEYKKWDGPQPFHNPDEYC